MIIEVDAIYDGEVLRPVDPLDLPPNTRVSLTLEFLPLTTPAPKRQSELGGGPKAAHPQPLHRELEPNDELTLQEIIDQYDKEWVLIDDPLLTSCFEVIKGRVLCHSKDREELGRLKLEINPKHSAVLDIGRDENIYML